MKASQILSEEIVLDKLLAKLMRMIIENAGAQKGFLILETKTVSKLRANQKQYQFLKFSMPIPLKLMRAR